MNLWQEVKVFFSVVTTNWILTCTLIPIGYVWEEGLKPVVAKWVSINYCLVKRLENWLGGAGVCYQISKDLVLNQTTEKLLEWSGQTDKSHLKKKKKKKIA